MPLPGGGRVALSDGQTRSYLRNTMLAVLDETTQEFIVAFPGARAVTPHWNDFDIPLRTLTSHLLGLALPDDCPLDVDPARVNSIYRPTLPAIWWSNVPLA